MLCVWNFVALAFSIFIIYLAIWSFEIDVQNPVICIIYTLYVLYSVLRWNITFHNLSRSTKTICILSIIILLSYFCYTLDSMHYFKVICIRETQRKENFKDNLVFKGTWFMALVHNQCWHIYGEHNNVIIDLIFR